MILADADTHSTFDADFEFDAVSDPSSQDLETEVCFTWLNVFCECVRGVLD